MAAPTDILLTNTKVNENAANGTVIGTLSAVDTDPTTYTWQLLDNAGGAFGLSGTSLVVANSSLLNYEANQSFTIQIQVTEGTSTYARLYTIYLNDLGESINGTAGNDTLTATNGGDTYAGDTGNDSIDAGAGNDSLGGGAGNDTMLGGIGNDTYNVDSSLDVVTDEAFFGGTDTVNSSVTYTLSQYIEGLTLTGSSNINAYGSVGANNATVSTANTLTGNSGSNILDGKGGADTMIGGAGNDTYYVDNTLDQVREDASAGTDTIISSVTYSLTVTSPTPAREVENLQLTGTTAINATGNGLVNTITGNDGNNIIDGKGGADSMSGGLGNDTYYVDDAGDKISETTADVLGTAAIEGGTDTVLAGVTFSIATFANVEKLTLTGSTNIDATGNTLNNTITGNTGNNVLTGGAGNDTLIGDLGNDTYVLDSASDSVSETTADNATTTGTIEGGIDTVRIGADYSIKIVANVERIELQGTGGFKATGNTLNNELVGNSGANWLDGDAGKDSMSGGTGDDTYVVDNSGDVVTELASGGTADVVESSASFTLGAELENLILTGSALVNGTGNSLGNSITGNGSANALDGKGGNDTMIGGAGDDTYYVDSLSDVVTETTGQGIDTIAVAFNYTLGTGSIENLSITGTAVSATGNGIGNVVTGNSNANTIDGGLGADTMAGGGGDDTYYVDNTGDIVSEANVVGTDTVLSLVSYSLTPSAGQPSRYVENLTLTGSGDLTATGNGLANALIGNGGNNAINGGAGNDTMTGGAGNDTYTVDSAGDSVIEAAGTDIDTVVTVGTLDFSIAALANIENITLSGTAINATGNASANLLKGNTAGNKLDGGTGADTMVGGSGNDTYIVDNTGDITQEITGGGTDYVNSSVTYTLAAYLDHLTLTGTTAINGTGNNGANKLVGNSAANTLDGKIGADTMVGGDGNDIYVVDSSLDVVDETTSLGSDTVKSSISYTLGTNLENLTLTGTQLISGTGNSGNNYLTGNAYANTLDGSTGNDTMAGGGGNDTYIVNVSGDSVVEGSTTGGTDTVKSDVSFTLGNNVENLILNGSTNLTGIGNGSDNFITGNIGNNVLTGGVGDDTLAGGAGNDTLSGNDGFDVYLFDTALNATTNVDKITGFDVTTDTIRLTQSIFTGITTLGTLSSAAFLVGTAATGLSDRILYNSTTGDLFYDADGTGATAAIKFATITAGLTTLSANDFFVV